MQSEIHHEFNNPVIVDEALILSGDENPAAHLLSEIRKAACLTSPTIEDIKKREVLMGPQERKNTLVLDLDNTLVYTVFTERSSEQQAEISIRPFAVKLLETMSKLYEIVLFTAGSKEYANMVRKCLDPSGRLVSRVLGSSSCFLTKEGYLVKDLRIFSDRYLKNIAIVDDQVTSFAFQLMNGIPVNPYFGEEEDDELFFLIEYLQDLAAADDVTIINKEIIRLVS